MDEVLVVLFVGLPVAALIGLIIGNTRGRPGAGFLFGLLIGPIGWLLVLTGPDYRSKCAECGGVVVKGARRCQHCGQLISPLANRKGFKSWREAIPARPEPTREGLEGAHVEHLETTEYVEYVEEEPGVEGEPGEQKEPDGKA